MESMLYEVAVLTPYTTTETYPLLGALDDHATMKRENLNVDLHWFLQPSEPVNSSADHSDGSNPKMEQWQELPSCIRSVDSTDFAFSTVSSLTLSTDPCLSDVSWGNRELCSTKYDHDDFEGVHFIPVAGTGFLPDLMQPLPGEMDTGIGTSLTDARSERCTDGRSSELENLLAKIAEDMCSLRTESRTKTANSLERHDLFKRTSETQQGSLAPKSGASLEGSLFVTAMSHLSDDDFYTTAASHFDHDDDSSSAFSSCRVSRSSSQCDLHEGAKHPENYAPERFGSHELPTHRLRKPLPTIKSVTPMPTMFTPPQNKEGRKLTTLLSVDLESCKSYDTCGSSGYCDSPTASSVFSDFSEFSCLNPLSKPFVPKAWAGVDHEDDLITRQRQALNIESFAADSGIELSHLNTSQRQPVHPPLDNFRCLNRETLPHDPVQPPTNPTDQNKSTEDMPAYLCSLKHGKEFTPVLDFSPSNLPEACRSITNVAAVKSIAQRVVKLRVGKPFSLLPESQSKALFPSCSIVQPRDSNSPVFDHYGTGFVFDIDAEYVHIRTHCKVVGSADEAAHAQVLFSVASEQDIITASCAGQRDGFSLKSHSQCAVLTCKTPKELLAHLHAFQEVPTHTRTSFFNDSCYYSDLSTDSSISDHGDVCADPPLSSEDVVPPCVTLETPSKHLTYADVVSCKQPKSEPSCGNQISVNPTVHSSPKQSREHIHNSNPHNMESPTKNPTSLKFLPSLSVFDPRVRRSFESVVVEDKGCNCRGQADIVQYEIDTPLVLKERRFEKCTSKACPYVGEKTFGSNGMYSYFSSYAGDVLSTIQIRGDTTEWSHPWGYESLVYAQNHRRDSYNHAHNLPQSCSQQSLAECSVSSRDVSSTRSGIGAASNNFSQSAKSCSRCVPLWESDTFRELSSVGAYLRTWDINLLNLDDSLHPLPEYDPVAASSQPCKIESSIGSLNHEPVDECENLVEAILREDTELSGRTRVEQSCSQKSFPFHEHAPRNAEDEAKCPPTYTLIISHPHGGPKMVSVGQLSRHHHTGWDLYDTPSCMGSCGAPVVFLSEASAGPFVAPLIHGGTTRTIGFSTGIGFTFFI